MHECVVRHTRSAVVDRPPAARADRLLSCWTRTEAVAKAAVSGVPLPFDRLAVSSSALPDTPTSPLLTDHHAAAVAVPGAPARGVPIVFEEAECLARGR